MTLKMRGSLKSILQPGSGYRIIVHAIFWISVLVFYTLFYGHQSGDYLRIMLFVVPLVIITIATTYFISYFLFPKFLITGQYRKLALFTAATLIISVWLESVTIMGMLALLLSMEGVIFDHSALNFFFLVVGMFFIVAIALGIKLLKMWYEKQTSVQLLAREKLEAELKLLKSQIHPHFLFNTLNNIYSLALQKSDSAPEMILKLSEILDYLLYDCDVQFVPLEKEITLIRNYIDLEQIRYSNRLNLELDLPNSYLDENIAPLILLPFVENAFKHGAAGKRDSVWISVSLKVEGSKLFFNVSNDKADKKPESPSHGIGLINVKKRLELVYGQNYKLEIKADQGNYQVLLQIALK